MKLHKMRCRTWNCMKINVFIDYAIKKMKWEFFSAARVSSLGGHTFFMSSCHIVVRVVFGSRSSVLYIRIQREKSSSSAIKMCCNDDGFWWINKYRNVMWMCNILELFLGSLSSERRRHGSAKPGRLCANVDMNYKRNKAQGVGNSIGWNLNLF